MKNKTKEKRTFTPLVALEVITLIFGTFLSIYMTFLAFRYDKSLAVYFLFGLLGIIMTAVLTVMHKKKKWYTFLIGIVFIAAYLVFAGYSAIKCALFAQLMDRISNYDDKEITAVCDGVRYSWNGDRSAFKSGLNRKDLTQIEKKPADKVTIDGEDRQLVMCRGEKENAIYVLMYGGASEIYLELTETK